MRGGQGCQVSPAIHLRFIDLKAQQVPSVTESTRHIQPPTQSSHHMTSPCYSHWAQKCLRLLKFGVIDHQGVQELAGPTIATAYIQSTLEDCSCMGETWYWKSRCRPEGEQNRRSGNRHVQLHFLLL